MRKWVRPSFCATVFASTGPVTGVPPAPCALPPAPAERPPPPGRLPPAPGPLPPDEDAPAELPPAPLFPALASLVLAAGELVLLEHAPRPHEKTASAAAPASARREGS